MLYVIHNFSVGSPPAMVTSTSIFASVIETLNLASASLIIITSSYHELNSPITSLNAQWMDKAFAPLVSLKLPLKVFFSLNVQDH